MDKFLKLLDRDERIRAELVALFGAYGYERYRMAKFESYDVYLKNKDFIDGESIITFTDSAGKVMALKPDVTLGIVNNLPLSGESKYFYDENVFRRGRDGSYREIRQVGLEYIGGDGGYSECEVVMLAVRALKAVGGECVLTLGHTDAVNAFLSPLGLKGAELNRALECITSKAVHELKKLLVGAGADEADSKRLIDFISLEGAAKETLDKAKKLAAGTAAEKALGELETLLGVLTECGLIDCVKLDFSLIADLRYYNGVLFYGYVAGAAKAVLKGGRYDNIVSRMGRDLKAVGFALDFNEAARLYGSDGDADVLVVSHGASERETMKAAGELVAKGLKVRVVKSDDGSVKAERRVVLGGEDNA